MEYDANSIYVPIFQKARRVTVSYLRISNVVDPDRVGYTSFCPTRVSIQGTPIRIGINFKQMKKLTKYFN